MNKKRFLSNLSLLFALSICCFIVIVSTDNETKVQSNNQQITQEINQLDVATNTTLLLAPDTSNIANAQNSSCTLIIDKWLHNFPPNEALYSQLHDIFDKLVTSDARFTANMLNESRVQMISSVLSSEEIHQNQISTNRTKPVTFDFFKSFAETVSIADVNPMKKAISLQEFDVLESWLIENLEAHPDKKLTGNYGSQTLLNLALSSAYFETIESLHLGAQSIVDSFKAAGYQISELDLILDTSLTNSFSSYIAPLFIEKLISSNFSGDLDMVYVRDPSMAPTNLVNNALYLGRYDAAWFWLNQGVSAVSTLSDKQLSKLNRVHLNFMKHAKNYKTDNARKKAFLNLLEAGALTYRTDPEFEQALNEFLSNNNAHEYFERFHISSLLPAEQENLIREKMQVFSERVSLIQSEQVKAMDERCAAQYVSTLNQIFDEKYAIYHWDSLKQRLAEQSEAIELERKAVKMIEADYKAGNITMDERLTLLSAIDGRIAKKKIDFIKSTAFFRSNVLSHNLNGIMRAESKNTVYDSFEDRYDLSKEYQKRKDFLSNYAYSDSREALYFLLKGAIISSQPTKILLDLIEKGAEIDKHMLMALGYSQQIDVLKTLVEDGLSIDKYAEDNIGLLYIAAYNKSKQTFDFALQAGANIELPTTGLDALDKSLENIQRYDSSFHFAEQLLSKGKIIDESHRQALRELMITHPIKTEELVNKYGIYL